MAVLEVTRLRVTAARTAAFTAARAGMVRSFTTRPGFLRAELVRVAEEEWLDLILWDRSEDFAASRRRGADTDEIAAFFGQIDEVLSSEEGQLWPV